MIKKNIENPAKSTSEPYQLNEYGFFYGGHSSTSVPQSVSSTITAPTYSTMASANQPPVVSGPVDLGTMLEDGSILITADDLLANASDPDGDPLSVSAIWSDSGNLSDNGNGTWTFQPDPDMNGAVNFNYIISDEIGSTSGVMTSASLDITAVNDAPVVSGPVDLGTMLEDGSILITAGDLLANASDPDGDPLSVSAIWSDSGNLSDNGNGTWTFQPDPDMNGAVNFNYIISDQIGSTSGVMTSASLDITAVNDAPVVSGPVDLGTMLEDGNILITADDLLANASDVDGDPLSVYNLTADSGTLIDNADGTWTYQPETNMNGAVNFNYFVTDNIGASYGSAGAATSASLDVTAVNDAPVVSGPVDLGTMLEDGSILITSDDLLANASDVDGDPLSVYNLTADSGTLIDNADGTWTYQPETNMNGAVNFNYFVTDNIGSSYGSAGAATSASLDVTAVNDAPVVSGPVDLGTMLEDGSILITSDDLLANASDPNGDPLSVTAIWSDSGNLLDNGNGTWTFQPEENMNGAVNFNYIISDEIASTSGTMTSASLDITAVNDAPVVSGPVDLGTMLEDGSILITANDLLANASDVDGDPLSVYNLTTDSGTLIDHANGTWTYYPEANMNGAVNFNYFVTDNIGSSYGSAGAATSASLDVTAVNDAPVVSGPVDLGTMLEDGSILITADDLLANANDVDGDPLSVYNLTTDSGTLIDHANGTWTYYPEANMNGAVNFNYFVTDNIGSSYGSSGAATSASLDVTAVNDAPVVSGPVDLGTMLEDGSILITANDLLANASDVDGDPLSVYNLTTDSGTLIDHANGTWTYYPEANMNGAVNFNYFVTDNIGSSYGSSGAATSASLDVTAVNDAPVVSGPVDLGTMLEDGSILITSDDLLANASDVDGDPLSVYNLTTDSGTLIDHANGTWTYYPEANMNGAVNFNYFVTDNIGSSYGSAGAATSASLDVTAVNDAPVVSGPVDLGTMLEDGSILITANDLLANASDVDGDPLSVYNLTTDSGTLIDHANGTWTYYPEANMNGAVNFNYFVTDNIGSSYGSSGAATSASLDVTAVNDAPVVSGPVDLGTMLEDGSILITSDDLLANASDVDGDPLSVYNLTTDSGTLIDHANGTWTYYPEANMNGAVNFNYFVTDNIGSSYGSSGAATSASLDVTAVNDAPVVSGPVDLGTMLEDGSILITANDLLANASDVDGDPLSVYNLTTDSGTLIDHANGTWTYYPEANMNGAVNFNYFVTDNIGSSYGSAGAATSASLDVTAVNDAPVVSGPVDLGAIMEDGSILITADDLLANASDVDGDPLSVYNLTADSGTLIDHANGTWTYHPEANMSGSVNFNYFVTDNIGASEGSGGASTSAALDVFLNTAGMAAASAPDMVAFSDASDDGDGYEPYLLDSDYEIRDAGGEAPKGETLDEYGIAPQVAASGAEDNTAAQAPSAPDGSPMTDADINQLIQEMSAYAPADGISLDGMGEVQKDDQLMTIIAARWQSV